MLFRKLWRDLIQNKTQFISIFLMSFLGMWIFVGMDSEASGAMETSSEYYRECNLADLWLRGNGFSSEEVKQVEEIAGIKRAEQRLILDGDVELSGEKYSMETVFLTTNEISAFRLLEGESYKPDEEGIWIEQLFAEAHNLSPGDRLQITLGSMEVNGIIKGIVQHPEYVYYLSAEETMMPNYSNYGVAFLSEVHYPLKSSIVYNQMILDLESESDEAQSVLKEKIEQVIDRDSVVITDRSQCESYQMFDAEISQHTSMGAIFSAVFLLIAVLGIITTMTRLTANQRTQIGTLKALGFSKNVITRHYVSYGFWISLMGSVLGSFVGYITLPKLVFSAFEGSYIMPGLHPMLSDKALVANALSILISTFVSFLACRKELIDPPAVTLKPAAPKKITHTALEKSRFWLRLSFSTQWNFRDVLRNKVRSMMGIIGVCGCTMLMLCAFGCNDAVISMLDWMYQDLMTAQSKIIFSEEADYYTIVDYGKEYKGQLIQENAVEFVSEEARETGTLTVLDTGNYMHYQGMKLENISLTSDGIAITYKMAKSLNIGLGDYVKWHIMGEDEWEKTRVTQIYRDPSAQGITMKRETFERLEHAFLPTSLLTNKSVPQSLADQDEIQAVMSVADMKIAFDNSMEVMIIMIASMIMGAAILGMIVLYNLGVLSFIEKMREIATLKVLGFKSMKIRGILQKQNIWITSAGIAIGLPAGYGMLVGICTLMPDTMDMVAEVSFPSYIYSVAGTFLVSVIVNAILSGKVKTIDMVDALKGVE